jgi:uncharacterized protein YeaC (DUF1315 family)
MEYQDLLEQLTPEIVANFKRALELGRWPDGRAVSEEQRAHCMQAVIAWDQLHLPEEQRVGFIDRGQKQGEQCDDPVEEEQTLRWDNSNPGRDSE